MMLPATPSLCINSNPHDLLLDRRPMYGPMDMHGYVDTEWSIFSIKQQAMGGGTMMLAGGVVGYKAGLLPPVVMSLTEATFMEVAVMGRIYL